MVSTQLKSCSNVCDVLVAFMLPSPAKYPAITDELATNVIAGASTINVYFTFGTFKTVVDIYSAPKNKAKDKINPTVANNFRDTLNILCAPLLSPNCNSF
jgi:hypothetical protein